MLIHCRWHQVVTFADMDKEPGNSKRQRYSTSSVHHSSNSRKVASEASSGESGLYFFVILLSLMYVYCIVCYRADIHFNMEHLKKKKHNEKHKHNFFFENFNERE